MYLLLGTKVRFYFVTCIFLVSKFLLFRNIKAYVINSMFNTFLLKPIITVK